MKVRIIVYCVAAAFAMSAPAGRAAEAVFISEFMAANNGVVQDEDGDNSDWIEIHNAGTTALSLGNWCLTDTAANLTRWRFPSTNIAANGYLLVFASGKNRRVPGAPLHTDFKLASSGGYLGLIKPDGVTVVSQFTPVYPPQVSGISYGVPVQEMVTTLIASGAVARVTVPLDGSMGMAWSGVNFDDAGWMSLPTGVGFETDGTFVSTALADSIAEFSGVQGQNNWFYGYWNKGTNANGIYTNSEFIPFPNNYWTGSAWDWPAGDPPFTQLNAQGGRPTANDGNPGLPTHWAVRRYVNENNGPVTLHLKASHTNASEWTYVTATGVASSSILYIYLLGAGEGYIDDMKLVAGSVPEAGVNLLANSDFEAATLNNWTVSPILAGSGLSTATVHSGSKSLHLVSTGVGASQATSIYQSLSPTLSAQTYTLSYWYLPVPSSPAAVVRFSGSWIYTTPSCGDGVVARVFVDGAPVFQQTVFSSSLDTEITVPAQLGSQIDFALDPGAATNDFCDGVAFSATVQRGNPALSVIADSAADWSVTGTQGEKNWFYGYYNRTADPDRVYQATNFTPFPRAPGPQSANNFWDQEEWDWFSGNPPFDKVGQYWMTPNGTNNGAEHWVIRRWVSSATGSVSAEWGALKEMPDQNNSGGGGVTMRLYQNGILRDSAVVPGGSVGGVRRTVTLNSVAVGDTIDIAVDPTNVDGRIHDDTDKTFVTLTLRGLVSIAGQVNSSLESVMRNVNATAYLRFPFNVTDPSAFNSLLLRMKYDDGFVAYLNGVEVARGNAPMTLAWNAAATLPRSDSEANQYQEFNISSSLGLLRAGVNVLAIQGLNAAANDGDFVILPELTATSETNNPAYRLYFALPTPGTANGTATATLGPLVTAASHAPSVPGDNDALQVTAKIAPTFNAVGTVQLNYRVMYGGEVNTPMFDDGAHGDGVAGDGIWGAIIPASASTNGQMVRYYVMASDALNNSTRYPAYLDAKNSPQYLGTVVSNPVLTNPLPVLQFFVQNPILATNAAGTRCSVFWDGEFYDNIEVNLHGQTTAFAFAKRSMNFNMNSGYKIRPRNGDSRVKAFDLITTASDKAFMRVVLSFGTFRDSGVPTHSAFPVRVQQNNAFHSVMAWVEQADDDFLQRNGLNPEGALYKMYLPLTNAYSGIHKQTRKNEPNDDLQALINGLNQTGTARRQFMFDNLDIAETVNFFATVEVVQNEDCCGYKNYYLYRDTDRSGEWNVLAWDLDLTLGRTFTGWIGLPPTLLGGYYDTNIYATNKWYSEQRSIRDFIGVGHPIFEALWAYPDTQNMFLRRWSSVQERFLQKSNSHPVLAYYEPRIDALTAQLAPDAALDLAQWGTFPPSAPIVQSQPFAATVLKSNYLAPRRGWVFNTLAFANGGPYLGSQPANAIILIGDIDYNPASGNQAQEYVQLRNTNNYSVDISGWKLGGGIQHTFRGGTVIPSNGVMYVSPDVTAFRARASGPRGGQGLYVQGNYSGQISARGETLSLTDNNGRSLGITNLPPTPSLAQQYLRITEIQFNPASPPPGLGANSDEFEYIKLKNIGPTALDLTGVRFASGIVFTFASGNLASGQSVAVVRNPAAFLSRHTGIAIAGPYSGLLDNNGENIRLDDATGENILDFRYEGGWYPITDGFGFALQIVNELAFWDTWGLKASWRPVSDWQPKLPPGGSQQLPPVSSIPPIFVNEALTHSIAPAVDVIELYNPNPNSVVIGGWFLSDDFREPSKYRIPIGTSIPARGYYVVSEALFNPTNPPSPKSFALSSRGDEIYLFSADGEDNLTGYYHGFSFGGADAGVTFGRHVNSVGSEFFVAQAANTLGSSNSTPKVGPVVISEIQFHPPNLNGDNSADEFIELQNITGAGVPLFDPANPTNTWQLRGGIDFNFPTNLTLGAGGFLVVANFDVSDSAKIASFRSRFSVPPGVAVLGPFGGQLGNSADTVKVQSPGEPGTNGVPETVVDQVDYSDMAPWPATADGLGASLQRLVPGQFGNDPANWHAAAPTAGAATGSGAGPVITVQPASGSVGASSEAMLSVIASGAAPLRYQWRYNGSTIMGATNPVLVLPNIQFAQAGTYNVAVFNQAGVTESSNAVLNVILAAYWIQQPASTNVKQGVTVNFSGLAISSSTIRYQWRFNGADMPNATNTLLQIANVQPNNSGVYQLFADDGVAPVPSAPATLTLVYDPFFAQQPISQTVLPGANVTLSVVVSNGATLPIGYRWRRSGTALTNLTLYSYTSFFTVSNVQPNFSNYNVVITNIALPLGRVSSPAILTFLTDTNGNGLADSWEADYFGAGVVVDPNGDPDLDGMSNLQEWIAGTDPLDGASYLKIDSLSVGTGATLNFGAISNRTYTVFSADAIGGPWLKLSDVFARSINRVETIFDPAAVTNRFYRVATPRQP